MFDKIELERYSRHILLNDVGLEGQKKLKKAKVLLIGMGGLGNPSSQYLAASGIGTIGLVDNDQVSLTNLQRQTLFQTEDIGSNKVSIAEKRLKGINPNTIIKTYPHSFTFEKALKLVEEYDLVLDCTDNFPTRYLINDICAYAEIPLFYGSIYQFDGQASVFSLDNNSPCYRCLYPEIPDGDALPNCNAAGVLGVLPGMIGIIQATEAIKHILGIGDSLSGTLLCYDALSMTFKRYNVNKRKDCQFCGDTKQSLESLKKIHISNPNRSDLCEIGSDINPIEEITPKKLKLIFKKITLVDVREPGEREISAINPSIHLPLNEIINHKGSFTRVRKDDPVVVYCKSGFRSLKAANQMKLLGYSDVRSLKGGILNWIATEDSSLAKY